VPVLGLVAMQLLVLGLAVVQGLVPQEVVRLVGASEEM
jgi:hypothetical protein